ncbi:MAG: hypothetical protein R3C68_12385 [Myxococcota bacterium]
MQGSLVLTSHSSLPIFARDRVAQLGWNSRKNILEKVPKSQGEISFRIIEGALDGDFGGQPILLLILQEFGPDVDDMLAKTFEK